MSVLLQQHYWISNGCLARALPDGEPLPVWPDVSTYARQAEVYVTSASPFPPWRFCPDGRTIDRRLRNSQHLSVCRTLSHARPPRTLGKDLPPLLASWLTSLLPLQRRYIIAVESQEMADPSTLLPGSLVGYWLFPFFTFEDWSALVLFLRNYVLVSSFRRCHCRTCRLRRCPICNTRI